MNGDLRARPFLSVVLPLALLLALLAAVGSVSAQQPLASLAPDSTVVALTYRANDVDLSAFHADLAALDWDGVTETFARLGTAIGDDLGGLSMRELGALAEFGGMIDGGDVDDALGDLREACPAVGELLPDGLDPLMREGLITVGVSAFNPMPVITAIARPGDLARTQDLQAALADCLGVGPSLEQGGVPLYLFGDGGELPLIVGSVADVVFASTNPDVARGIVRRAQGSDEASLADRAVWRARSDMRTRGLGLTVDLAAVADVVESFVPRGGDPELELLFDRGLPLLRTIGGFSAEIALDADGVALESVVAVDPAGGDAALADLLLCPSCTARPMLLAPRSAVGVRSQRLPIRALVDYIDGLLADAGDLVDGPTSVRAAFADATGEDLDEVLLGWIGDDSLTVDLAPLDTRLETLLFGPPRFTAIPVASEAAANAGLDAIGRVLEPYRDDLAGMFALGAGAGPGLLGALSDGAGLDGLGELGGLSGIAVRHRTVNGIDVRRIQIGLGLDAAVAVVRSHLVIATPASAIDAAIATAAGAPSFVERPEYRALADLATGTLTERAWTDVGASLDGAADMADALSQPMAAAARAALLAVPVASEVRPADAGADGATAVLGAGYPIELDDSIAVRPLPSDAFDAELRSDQRATSGDVARYYDLGAPAAGSTVRIVMTSDAFDTYLRLVDPAEGLVLLENDDAPTTSRSEVVFEANGRVLWIEIGSFFGDSTGPFRLEVSETPPNAADTASDGAAAPPGEAAGAPSFADFLVLSELPGDVLGVLSDRVGALRAVTSVDGTLLRSRAHLEVRW